jgi:hypothetical protein
MCCSYLLKMLTMIVFQRLSACVNNDFKRVHEFRLNDNEYSIFMLEGTEICGQAPPYLEDEQISSEF